MSSSSVYNTIKVNVGGKIFETFKETLMRSGYFNALFINTEVKDIIFVDYDPEIFNHVLSYLRDPKYICNNKYKHAFDFFDVQYDNTQLYNKEYIQCQGLVDKDKHCDNKIIHLSYYTDEVYCSQCKDKICEIKGCNYFKSEHKKYCDSHGCSLSNCDKKRYKYKYYCKKHCCKNIECKDSNTCIHELTRSFHK
jgi:hypothetical protein